MPSFTPYHFNHPGNQMKLRLWKPWRARGQWGTRNVVLGWYATREEAEKVEFEWRQDKS
jgi:hypothetical protein